jgi:hypothetical protein
LTLSLSDEFEGRERWWIAIILAATAYSILAPPLVDPYVSKPNDCWTGLGRAVPITIISAAWRLTLLSRGEVTALPVDGGRFHGMRLICTSLTSADTR